jgi:hypothetical protein
MGGAWVCVWGRCRLGHSSEIVNRSFNQIKNKFDLKDFIHKLLTFVNEVSAIKLRLGIGWGCG